MRDDEAGMAPASGACWPASDTAPVVAGLTVAGEPGVVMRADGFRCRLMRANLSPGRQPVANENACGMRYSSGDLGNRARSRREAQADGSPFFGRRLSRSMPSCRSLSSSRYASSASCFLEARAVFLGSPEWNRTGLRIVDPVCHGSTECAIDEIYGELENFSFCFKNP